jgi:hypothetical protein
MKQLLLFLLALPVAAQGQVLLVLPGTDDPGALRFNERFIERNRIAAITGQRMVKPDFQPMRNLPEKHLYRFDAQGRTVYSNHSYGKPGTGLDTASVAYTHNAAGQVTRILRNDLGGYFAHDLLRDTQGRVVRETYSRIENLGPDRYTLVPGAVTEISDEHHAYEQVNDTTVRHTIANNLGLPYREQLWISDRSGYLRRIEDRYLVNNRRGRITFGYDEKGRLVERTEQPDLAQPRTLRRTWAYDEAGNVIASDLHQDGRHVEHEEYLYEEGTMFLKARLTKDMASNAIHVVRYHTERR